MFNNFIINKRIYINTFLVIYLYVKENEKNEENEKIKNIKCNNYLIVKRLMEKDYNNFYAIYVSVGLDSKFKMLQIKLDFFNQCIIYFISKLILSKLDAQELKESTPKIEYIEKIRSRIFITISPKLPFATFKDDGDFRKYLDGIDKILPNIIPKNHYDFIYNIITSFPII